MSIFKKRKQAPAIEDVIKKNLTGHTQENALDFVAFLSAGEIADGTGRISIGRYKEEDDVCWPMLCKSEWVGNISINAGGWTIYIDGEHIGEHMDFPVDEQFREFVWAHVDHCGNCGQTCYPGRHKRILGKEFENVCDTPFHFPNPDAETMENIRKLIAIRQRDIISELR